MGTEEASGSPSVLPTGSQALATEVPMSTCTTEEGPVRLLPAGLLGVDAALMVPLGRRAWQESELERASGRPPGV
ncbi:MAG: hypothetical protein ACJ789_18430 [Thermomicrobiales bacterium]